MLTELFTVKQLCERYGVHPITIRRWIADGSFPQPLRIGRRRVSWPVQVVIEHEQQLLAKVGTENIQQVEV